MLCDPAKKSCFEHYIITIIIFIDSDLTTNNETKYSYAVMHMK